MTKKIDLSIFEALFGRKVARMFSDRWPVEPMVLDCNRDALPEAMRDGDASSLEALSAAHTGSLRVGGARNKWSLFEVSGSALSFHASGLTVGFDDIHRSIPSLHDWAAQLCDEIGMPLDSLAVSAFASPGDRRGFPFHYDGHDVLVIPLQGEKRFSLEANPEVVHPVVGYNPGAVLRASDLFPRRGKVPPGAPRKHTKVITIKPGQALYLPAGYWHATEHPGPSLSVSCGFMWPNAADLALARLRSELLRDPAWRRPAYGAWHRDPEVRKRAVDCLATTLTELPSAIEKVCASDAMLEGPSLAQSFLHLRPETRFQVAPSLRYAFEPKADDKPSSELRITSSVSYTEFVLEIQKDHVAACRWLGSRKRAFSVAELMSGAKVSLDVARDVLQCLTDVGAICRIAFQT